jgi:predicted transcriptional regulator
VAPAGVRIVLPMHGKSLNHLQTLRLRVSALARNTLSFHFNHLSNAGILSSHREGRSVIYTANFDMEISKAFEYTFQLLKRHIEQELI